MPPEPVSWPRAVWLHLSPGLPVMALYLVGGRWLEHRGQPADLALAAGIVLFMLPIELGRALRAGHRATGRWGFAGGVDFRQPMPARRFVGRASLLLVVSFGLLFATLGIGTALADGPLAFLPHFLSPHYDWTTLPRPRLWLLAVGVILIVVNGLLAPWIEEVYFRGHLLPRLPGTPAVNVVAGGVLFAVEHLWQPQNWILIGPLAILLGWATLRWRNIWLAYTVHAFANSFGIVILLIGLLTR